MTFLSLLILILDLSVAFGLFMRNSMEVLLRLDESFEDFEKEVEVISTMKCLLLNHLDPLKEDTSFMVFENDAGYRVYYDGLVLDIELDDGLLADYSLS